MAAITAQGNTFTTAAGNKTVTATPAVGDLIVVLAANSGRTTAQAPTITDDQNGVYELLASATKATNVDSQWIFVRTALVPAAVSTIFTMTQTGDTGGGLAVFSVSGMQKAGLACLVQSGKQDNAAAGTPSITLGAAVQTGNPVFGQVTNGTNSTTTTAPPTGWTESYDTGHNSPTHGREACWRASGETNTTIAFTGASASAFCSLIVELDASDPRAHRRPPTHAYMQAVNRAGSF